MKKGKMIFLCFIGLAFVVLNNIAFDKLFNLPKMFYVSFEEIEEANNENLFGNFVDLSFEDNGLKTDEAKQKECNVVFKLFGFIPIKKVKVQILPEEEVYLGGMTIGLEIKPEGALVVSNTIVDANQNLDVNKNKYFHNGDIIKES